MEAADDPSPGLVFADARVACVYATAVEATRIGALDFLEKPIALQRLLATVKRALRNPETAAAPQLSIAAPSSA